MLHDTGIDAFIARRGGGISHGCNERANLRSAGGGRGWLASPP
ncbi:hypothetical protein Thiowin_02033 [Thiorhodovibrio winogradskyi]|uniref:Uncharacterized protein n=1 Tax=Thiorhodovibrio winogradskyi TaxID=77007 RepID=A0ABZ0S9D9_9GAMM